MVAYAQACAQACVQTDGKNTLLENNNCGYTCPSWSEGYGYKFSLIHTLWGAQARIRSKVTTFFLPSCRAENFYKVEGEKKGDREIGYELANKLEEAKLTLSKEIDNYKAGTHRDEDFRQLANGVFQSEGCVSAWFNGGSLLVSPIVYLGQTYTNPEVLSFFVKLYHELGKIGKLSIVYSDSGKLFIKWQITNWDLILNQVSPYFDCIYGEKFQGFKKLKAIYGLKSNLNNIENKAELVRLVYSMNSSGNTRKLSIEDKLKSLNLEGYSSEPNTSFKDNPLSPTFLFILGFFLGDGGIYVRIRITTSGALNFIPSLILFQKPDNRVIHMFERMSETIKSLGINSFIVEGEGKLRSANIRIEGISAISNLVPFLSKNSNLLYWKSDDVNMVLKFLIYHSAGLYTYQKGLIAILNLLYQDNNKRNKTLEEWVKLVESHLVYLNTKYKSGHQFINSVTKLNEQIGWRVNFSDKLLTVEGKALKMKSFLFSTYGSKENALKVALEYRDSILESHFKEWHK